jgi:hypothetical protein
MMTLLMFAEMTVPRRLPGLAPFDEEETDDREGLERVIIVTDTGFLVAQVATRSQSCMFGYIISNMFGSSRKSGWGICHTEGHVASSGAGFAHELDTLNTLATFCMDLMLMFVFPALEFGGGCVVNCVASLKYAERDSTHHVEVGQDSMGGGSCLVAETLTVVSLLRNPFNEDDRKVLGEQLFIA